mmetsp:Transcript_16589/g.51604  ORF Transcript_16589/g.51604 Transcript_16589/m.51604 type:complete len:822 (-) Transcript_16589:1487-3952(-)
MLGLVLGHPWQLPLDEAALRVGHERKMAAVLGAEGGDAMRRTIRVERIRLGRHVGVVRVAKRRLVVREHVLLNLLIREVHLALAVRHPHAERRPLHALEQHRVRLEHGERRVARLEATRLVVHEARLLGLRQERVVVSAWHPAKKGHELAAVAHAEREGIRPRAEVLELVGEVELDLARPALCRVEDVCVRESTDERDAAEGVECHAAGEQVGDGHVPRLDARRVQRARHVAVAVRALLTQHGDARLARREGEARRRRRRRREGEGPRRVLARTPPLRLGARARRVALQQLELVGGALPHVAQLDHRPVDNDLAVDRHARARADGADGAEHVVRDARLGEDGVHLCELRGRHLDNHAHLLGEEEGDGVDPLRSRELELDAHVAREGHLERRNDQPAVGAVVRGKYQAVADELLHRLKERAELGARADVGRLLAELAVDVSERRAAEPVLAVAEVEEEEGRARLLEVGRRHLGHVGHAAVGGEDECAGALHLGAVHGSGHRQRVLAAVDRDAELAQQVAQRDTRVVHACALALHLRRPHPVARRLDVTQRRDARRAHVGQRLSDGHPRHRRRAQQADDRLLADGRGDAGERLEALRDDRAVRERRVQRADALLPRDEAGDGAVDFVHEEALRADGQEREDALERVLDASAAEVKRLGRHLVVLVGENLLGHLAEHERELEVDGRRAVDRVEENNAPIARHFTEVRHRRILALGDLLEERQLVHRREQRVVLLVLRAPDLANRHALVAAQDLAHVHPPADGLADLLEHVAVAARALVVDRVNRVVWPEVDARADDPVHLVLHLRVAALHGVKVEVRLRGVRKA